mgnify:CR=1 FL=1
MNRFVTFVTLGSMLPVTVNVEHVTLVEQSGRPDVTRLTLSDGSDRRVYGTLPEVVDRLNGLDIVIESERGPHLKMLRLHEQLHEAWILRAPLEANCG